MFLCKAGGSVLAATSQVMRVGTCEPPLDTIFVAEAPEIFADQRTLLICEEDPGRPKVSESSFGEYADDVLICSTLEGVDELVPRTLVYQ